MITIEQWQTVAGAPAYQVVQGGEYELLDLVPCRRIVETGVATGQFLVATIIGVDPAEVQE